MPLRRVPPLNETSGHHTSHLGSRPQGGRTFSCHPLYPARILPKFSTSKTVERLVMSNLNDININTFLTNKPFYREFHELLEHLALDHTQLKARYSSSVVARSELEFFNTSSPRFSEQYYLGNPHSGQPNIFNIRRIKELMPTDLPDTNEATLIADCLVSAPPTPYCEQSGQSQNNAKSLSRNYHILQSNALNDYGFCDTPGMKPVLPYIKQSPLYGAGGLCSQSCCFMATATLAQFALSTFGLAEITFTNNEILKQEATLDGMTEHDMARYFQTVGLNAIPQRYDSQLSRSSESTLDCALNAFKTTVSAYIYSGFPVIISCDHRKLIEYFVTEKKYFVNPSTANSQQLKHNVMIVGVSQDCEYVVIHDPQSFPFLEVPTKLLYCWGFEDVGHPDPYVRLLPVTPKYVQSPLMTPWSNATSSHTRDRIGAGVMEIAGMIDQFREHDAFKNVPISSVGEKKSFHLLQLCDLASITDSAIKSHLVTSEASSKLRQLLGYITKCVVTDMFYPGSMWIWVECFKEGIRIYNAQKAIPLNENGSLDPHFLPTFMIASVLFSELGHDDTNQITNALQHSGQNLYPGAITSFSLNGPDEWSVAMPQLVESVEIYAFMRNDLPYLFGDFVKRHNQETLLGSARSLMAFANSQFDEEDYKRIAEKLHRLASRGVKERDSDRESLVRPRQRFVSGFATFLPEIVALIGDKRQEEAASSLRFLVSLGHQLSLHSTFPKDVTFTIELVAGCLLAYKPNSASPPRNRSELLQEFLRRLSPIAAECINKNVQLSIELEPGPLFLVRSRNDLAELAALLETEEFRSVRHYIGLNLDIAHWAKLSDISLTWLNSPEGRRVLDLIAHVHVSDHTKSHHRDRPVPKGDEAKWLRPWVEFVKHLGASSREPWLPRYSRCISVELEAAMDTVRLHESVDNLNTILSQDNC